jgi:2,4-dienoyl-CoA reductase-like NADH-dependent reductase (Old Yellow Enzyme family)/thioredoxin reductase
MGQFDKLFEPLKIRKLVLRNRIVSTGHAEVYADAGLPSERQIRYHAEKARGGIGLTICGGSSSVSIDSPSAAWNGLDVSHDRIVPHLARFAQAVHEHGAALMIQLTHMGRRSRWDIQNWPHLLSPSGIREPVHRSNCKTIEAEDIARIVRDFGQAVRRCLEAGLDGAEISAAHQHLIDQFWSPRTNKRTDRYGGSFENRVRFGVEIFEEIRRVVGDGFVVGIRMCGDEFHPDGLDQAELLKIARFYAQQGLVDFIDVIGSGADTHAMMANIVPSMAYPPEPFLYLASRIKSEVDVPVMHAQNIKDPVSAARIIAEGHVDLVGMTRAHIADPHLVIKLREGRADEIRQCVGANYCIDRNYRGADVLCVQNAATGRERAIPHVIPRATRALRVVVVGGGPAGMEAARVCAQRGHSVSLFEKAPALGGQITLAARAPARDQMAGITRWLSMELQRLKVDVRVASAADAHAVRALKPQVVVLATGGEPDLAEHPLWRASEGAVVSGHAVLAGAVQPAASVLVYDEQGGYAGSTAADFLAQRGCLVELVTPDLMVAEDLGGTTRPVYLKRFYEKDVILTVNLSLHEVYREGERRVAVLRNEFTGQDEERVVDQVVVEAGVRPLESLYYELKPLSRNRGQIDQQCLTDGRPQPEPDADGEFVLYRVGDCVSPRDIHAAIYDSIRLCKDV